MIKSWLIAGGVFIVGLFAMLLLGKAKQKAIDKGEVVDAVKTELNRISDTAKASDDHVKNLPESGPKSSPNELRDDWSER